MAAPPTAPADPETAGPPETPQPSRDPQRRLLRPENRLPMAHATARVPAVYTPSCRQGVFSETPIHPFGCLCFRTGAKGRFLARKEISTSHPATRLDRYSLFNLGVLITGGRDLLCVSLAVWIVPTQSIGGLA